MHCGSARLRYEVRRHDKYLWYNELAILRNPTHGAIVLGQSAASPRAREHQQLSPRT